VLLRGATRRSDRLATLRAPPPLLLSEGRSAVVDPLVIDCCDVDGTRAMGRAGEIDLVTVAELSAVLDRYDGLRVRRPDGREVHGLGRLASRVAESKRAAAREVGSTGPAPGGTSSERSSSPASSTYSASNRHAVMTLEPHCAARKVELAATTTRSVPGGPVHSQSGPPRNIR
jgi:hypothetical protein